MDVPILPPSKREFHCSHCKGRIAIPYELPPTTAPCPHCGVPITSPALDELPDPPPPTPVPGPPAEPPVLTKPTRPAKAPEPEPEPVPVWRRALVPGAFVIVLVVLCVGIVAALMKLKKQVETPVVNVPVTEDPAVREAQYLRSGWKTDAFATLAGFMNAKTTQEKLPFIINGPALAKQVDAFYRNRPSDASDTPADAFSDRLSSKEDQQRGIFVLSYEQPNQVEMKEFFRPIAKWEVEWDLEPPDPLLACLANANNFSMDAVNVMAFFLRTPDGLKLDWETFVQTKYHTFQNFHQEPQPGTAGVFRVVMWEDLPIRGEEIAGCRTYRVVNPSNPSDGVRVNVAIDSEIGKRLAEINWMGVAGGSKPATRAATVELKWSPLPNPQITLSRFICWEFLGLGGRQPSPLESPAPPPKKAAPY